jgi:hypothetical protein
MLDLFAWLPSFIFPAVLADACKLSDPRLVTFATLSLVRRGVTVPPDVIERAAASAEMRVTLFDGLDALGHRDLFPAKWATQEALAEGVMVRWLIYPTELGRAPDAIELMKRIRGDEGRNQGDEWFLFRFRVDADPWKDDGWMAGVAGPFAVKDEPTTRAGGDTFSTFTKWDSKTPDAHVADVRALIEKAFELQKQGVVAGLDAGGGRAR